LLVVLAPVAIRAQQAAASPEDIRALAELLAKPNVQAWLKSTAQTSTAVPPPPPSEGAARFLGSIVDSGRASLRRLAAAVPRLPEQFSIISHTLAVEFRDRGVLGLLAPLAVFGLLGALAEAAFRRASAGLQRRIIELPVATIEDRLRAVFWRTLYGIGIVGAFGAGSLGAFLAFDWPPLLQEILLTYLIAVVAVRLTVVLGRLVLAPAAERFRLLPMSASNARYWLVWSAVLVGAFYFAKGTFRLVPVLGADMNTRTLVGSVLSIGVLALALIALWRRPAPDGSRPLPDAHDGWTWLLTLYLVGVWSTVFTGDTAPFDIGIVLLLVALAVFGLSLAVGHLLQSAAADAPGRVNHTFAVLVFHRGLRLAVIVGAALSVASILGLDLTALAASDTLATRMARAALDIVIIVLLAELVWQLLNLWIDRRLDAASADGAAGGESGIRRRHRQRTFLPILRYAALALVILIASLTALSTMGIAIGPLVAGAGVFGLAIGLGAQTLVKDIIAGMFFLFDDAFRIGEYIESGNIKGTVEGFSLRSVRLRHQHGAVHTVPFGALTTITNLSRDWTIDKMVVDVTYETDLDALKRVIKDVGRELKSDPQMAPEILQPLKMQGVEEFGGSGTRVVLKMMIRPGDQVPVRWRARALIKRAFDKHGIKLAVPTVAVTGEAVAAGAAAARGFDLVQQPSSAAAG